MFRRNFPLKNLTTWRIGGNAEYYFEPDENNIFHALKFVAENNIELRILGGGSNVLISSDGVRGLVLDMTYGFKNINFSDGVLCLGSGVISSFAARFACDLGFEDLKFLVGIPGTIGGAVFMNAGAYGQEIQDSFFECKVLRRDGKLEILSKRDMEFSYRHSILQKEFGIILESKFNLRKGCDVDFLKKEMKRMITERISKQPKNSKNAGSVFKSCDGIPAGKLIEDAGLKGLMVGDARVCFEHANWIENLGNATSEDVLKLISEIRERVFDKFSKTLEAEVRIF